MSPLVRILYISRAYGERSGGMERLSFELVQALRQAGSEVRVIPYQGPRWLAPLFVVGCIVPVLLLARRSDVVHLGDPLLAMVGWLVKKILNRPVVVTVHGLDITYPPAWYQWYLRQFFYGFDHYIAISHHVKELLASRRVRNVTVINPGFYDRFYQPGLTRADLDRLLAQATSQRHVLCTVGRLVPRKGQAWFISQVLPQLPTSVLYIIAGDGPARAEIEQAVTTHQVHDRVQVLGSVSPQDLMVLYNTVDAFIQPSIAVPGDTEGFGLVLVEAASGGRHVLAAALGGITDAIVHQQNGILLPAGDARAWITQLGRLIADPDTQLSPGAIRAFTLDRFAWKTIIKKYVGVYQALALLGAGSSTTSNKSFDLFD